MRDFLKIMLCDGEFTLGEWLLGILLALVIIAVSTLAGGIE